MSAEKFGIKNEIDSLEQFMRAHLNRREVVLKEISPKLVEAMSYSLFSGGKRFRPQIGFLISQVLAGAPQKANACQKASAPESASAPETASAPENAGASKDTDEPQRVGSRQKFTPFAAAVEFVHTYSLIHDDLPAMDNDDLRRGKPTCHKVFGEDVAILAGDALLTEAFYIISEHYSDDPRVGLALTKALSVSSGMMGMISGQVLDMKLQGNDQSPNENKFGNNDRFTINHQSTHLVTDKIENYKKMHELKTGALIRVMAEGACLVAHADKLSFDKLVECAEHLGLAFQIKDDLLDYDENDLEPSGFPIVMGLDKTVELLTTETEAALRCLNSFGNQAEPLRALIRYNQERTH